MKILLIGAAVASILCMTLPAAAQINESDRAVQLAAAIDSGLNQGEFSSADARDLRAQLRAVERMDRRYQGDGMPSWEARDLDRRYEALANQVNVLVAD